MPIEIPSRNAVLILGLLASCSAFADPITYLVTVDTSSLSGTSGFLDFQFDPGDSTTQSASADISDFSPGANLAGPPSVTGDVLSTLPATIFFNNDTAYNDYFTGFHYGASLTFLLTLTGPALTSPNGTADSGSTFGFGLYDSGQNPVLTADPYGFTFTVDVNLDGTNTVTNFDSTAAGGRPVATLQTPEAVPEPRGGFLFGGLCLTGMLLARRLRRNERAVKRRQPIHRFARIVVVGQRKLEAFHGLR